MKISAMNTAPAVDLSILLMNVRASNISKTMVTIKPVLSYRVTRCKRIAGRPVLSPSLPPVDIPTSSSTDHSSLRYVPGLLFQADEARNDISLDQTSHTTDISLNILKQKRPTKMY